MIRDEKQVIWRVMELIGSMQPHEFLGARHRARRILAPRVAVAMEDVLQTLERLAIEIEVAEVSAPPRPLAHGDASASSLTGTNSTMDDVAREIAAILHDTQFAPTRRAVVDLAESFLLPQGMLAWSGKDSRRELVRKVLAAMTRLPPSERSTAFERLRREYLRGRQSSLTEWSDVISPEK